MQRFDAEVTEKKADDAPKVKRTRTDCDTRKGMQEG